jgi:hypothetical protein
LSLGGGIFVENGLPMLPQGFIFARLLVPLSHGPRFDSIHRRADYDSHHRQRGENQNHTLQRHAITASTAFALFAQPVFSVSIAAACSNISVFNELL